METPVRPSRFSSGDISVALESILTLGKLLRQNEDVSSSREPPTAAHLSSLRLSTGLGLAEAERKEIPQWSSVLNAGLNGDLLLCFGNVRDRLCAGMPHCRQPSSALCCARLLEGLEVPLPHI